MGGNTRKKYKKGSPREEAMTFRKKAFKRGGEGNEFVAAIKSAEAKEHFVDFSAGTELGPCVGKEP